MHTDADQKEILNSFIEILGEESVVTDSKSIKEFSLSTIGAKRNFSCILYPSNEKQVSLVLKIASKNDISIHPVSQGKNWGYGSSNPPKDCYAILSLKKMNKILDYDNEIGTVVVEPGVTQKQLSEFLLKNKSNFYVDVSGAGPETSILGNIVERGYGIGRFRDHFLHSSGMEIVLANGEILRTGLENLSKKRNNSIYKWGVGPYIEGLFTQSNFGVVTKIVVHLCPLPENLEVFVFQNKNENGIFDLIDPVRSLLMHGHVNTGINILDGNRALTSKVSYNTLIKEKNTFKKYGVSRWNGVGAIYGTNGQIKSSKKAIKKQLKNKTSKLIFISNRKLKILQMFSKYLEKFFGQGIVDSIEKLFEIFSGKPNQISLRTPYWKHSSIISEKIDINEFSLDPARDKCGLMWVSPLVPMKKEEVRRFLSIINKVHKEHEIEPCITFTAISDRIFDVTIPILFNQECEEELNKAKIFRSVLIQTLKRDGFYPYRFGIDDMSQLIDVDNPYWKIISKLKGVFDPFDIISPGRYCQVSKEANY